MPGNSSRNLSMISSTRAMTSAASPLFANGNVERDEVVEQRAQPQPPDQHREKQPPPGALYQDNGRRKMATAEATTALTTAMTTTLKNR